MTNSNRPAVCLAFEHFSVKPQRGYPDFSFCSAIFFIRSEYNVVQRGRSIAIKSGIYANRNGLGT